VKQECFAKKEQDHRFFQNKNSALIYIKLLKKDGLTANTVMMDITKTQQLILVKSVHRVTIAITL